ncbi:MAG: rhodanese-like domain-containing protein [Verrucomicrobiota bacterium]
MKPITSILAIILIVSLRLGAEEPIKNPLIDYDGFEQIVVKSKAARESKRLSEAEFLSAIESGEYVLLDARSKQHYESRHITGAINLPFTEFSAESLADILPNKDTKILIYCNNNFLGDQTSMFSKSIRASLNVNTQASLRAYGYETIYELGPLLDVDKTKLPFSGTLIN